MGYLDDPGTLGLIAAIFLIAGMSKGVVGLGLPTISIGLGTVFIGLEQALALATVPVIVTNCWQGLVGGAAGRLLRRNWSMFLPAMLFTWIASGLLARTDTTALSGLLGLILIAYAVLTLTAPRIPSVGRNEIWLGPVSGMLTGIITGLTGSSVVPGVLYLQALGLSRDELVQAMGLLFTASYVGLLMGLTEIRLLTPEIAGVSSLAVLPALAGMAIGQRIRHRVPEARFRTVFLSAVLCLGVYIAVRAVTVLL